MPGANHRDEDPEEARDAMNVAPWHQGSRLPGVPALAN